MADLRAVVRNPFLTGFGFAPVAQLLKAELVSRDESRVGSNPRRLWKVDTAAHAWIDRVAPLAAAARAQQQRADIDTDLTMALVAFLAMPLMLAEAPTIAILAFAIDLIDLAVTTVHELSQYFASEAELELALGASILLGTERYQTALESAKGGFSVAFGIGTSMLGAIMGGLGAAPKISALRRVARGRHLVRNLESGANLASLRPVDLQDYGAFALSARMRADTDGIEALSAIERRAIDMVDEYRAASRVRVMAEMDPPPPNAADAFVPSARVRFDPDAESGLATPFPAGSSASRTTGGSGNPPNTLSARMPFDKNLKFNTPGGKETLPLGGRVGEPGSTSEVFAHADYPDTYVIRITYVKEGSPAKAMDDFGRTALDELGSSNIRVAKESGSFKVTGGTREVWDPVTRQTVTKRISHVAIVERADMFGIGTPMNNAQRAAFKSALEDLNRRGLVWLDNKANNFAFKTKVNGSLEVVVIDPGGIVPVRVNMDLPAPNLARTIQLIVNGEFDDHVSIFSWIRKGFRTTARKSAIRLQFEDAFDYEKLGIAGIDELHFLPRSGEDYPELSRMFSEWQDP